MEGIRDALLRMVEAYRETKELESAFVKVGLKDSPLWDIQADIMDAVSHIIGEKLDENQDFIKDSVTYLVLNVPILTNERRAEMLYSEFKKNYRMPKPETFEPEEMRKLFNENGGYMTPEGDWQ